MKFFGNGVVWDAERSKALCRFDKSGELETDDKRICDKLVELGYKHDGEIIDVEYEKVEEVVTVIEEEKEVVEDIGNYEAMTNKELRKILEDKGYMNLERKNKTQLLTMLEGD